jgi:hypothetical protein
MNLLEQMEHPEKWYIPVTEDNREELEPWWRKQIAESGWTRNNKNAQLSVKVLLLSKHPYDNSHYYCGSEGQLNRKHPSYQKITLEQFRQITNPNLKS